MIPSKMVTWVASLCLLAGSALAQEDYQIRLDRPHKVGEKFKVAVQAEDTRGQKVSQDDKVLQDGKVKVKANLEATMEVLAVDEAGDVTKAAYTVAKFDAEINGNSTKALDEGAVITAGRKDGQKLYLIKDEPAPQGLARLLDLVIPVKEEGKPDKDPTFGTKQRQKVGDSWAVNSELIAKGLSGKALKVAAENVSGKTTLVEAVTVGDVKCLRLKVEVTLQNVSFPLPPGSKTLEATIGIGVEAVLPVDPALPLVEDKTRMNMLVKAQIQAEGNTQLLEMVNNRTATVRYTPVK